MDFERAFAAAPPAAAMFAVQLAFELGHLSIEGSTSPLAKTGPRRRGVYQLREEIDAGLIKCRGCFMGGMRKYPQCCGNILKNGIIDIENRQYLDLIWRERSNYYSRVILSMHEKP